MDFKDNSQAVKAQLEKNIAKALTAMGYKWQEIVTMEMNTMRHFCTIAAHFLNGGHHDY